jgi:hypothetical protein
MLHPLSIGFEMTRAGFFGMHWTLTTATSRFWKSMTEEGNTLLTLHNDSIEELTGGLTMLAQMHRVMRNHEKAEQMETIRNTIDAQYYS